MNRLLLSLLIMSSSLISSTSFANSTNEKAAYDACIEHTFMQESTLFAIEFPHLFPQEQAKYCVNFLQKDRPDLAKDLDLKSFEQGFLDGRYEEE